MEDNDGRSQDEVDAIDRHVPEVEIGYTRAEQLNQRSYIVTDEKSRDRGFGVAFTLDQGVAELADRFRAFV